VDSTSVLAAVVCGAFVTDDWPVLNPRLRRAPSATSHATIQAAAEIGHRD
jgi:hypothetical protein